MFEITLEVLRSEAYPKILALSCEDTRIAGADAGPWTVVHTFHTTPERLLSALADAGYHIAYNCDEPDDEEEG